MAFAGDDTGGYGAGGERIAMEDWRMFARRRPKTSNSESVVRDEFMGRRGEVSHRRLQRPSPMVTGRCRGRTSMRTRMALGLEVGASRWQER